jgi:hypothetical protein
MPKNLYISKRKAFHRVLSAELVPVTNAVLMMICLFFTTRKIV